ncbi:hypothetical protein [Cryptosporangium japonicum]|uniref:Uncharacterized protein n=1 Tax=Cryptosporangium japonicum TaxID=80872 RepID=A0ABN0UZ46_9ACTN
MPDDPESLLAADWELPLTEEFVAGVRRGVRRRRLVRRAAAAGSAAVVALVAALVLTGSDTTTAVVPPATAPVGSPLGGFEVGYVPSGVRAETRDGSFSCAVTAGMRECRQPGPGVPAATLLQRRYDRDSGAAWMWITVLRPLPVPGGDSATMARQLVDWLTIGTSSVSTFDAPAGRARLVAARGSEVTVYSIVLTTADGIVVSITGNGALPAAELTAVARGIRR